MFILFLLIHLLEGSSLFEDLVRDFTNSSGTLPCKCKRLSNILSNPLILVFSSLETHNNKKVLFITCVIQIFHSRFSLHVCTDNSKRSAVNYMYLPTYLHVPTSFPIMYKYMTEFYVHVFYTLFYYHLQSKF